MSSPLGDGMPSRRRVEENNNSSASTRLLVETLQNCLKSPPQSSSNMSNPSGAPSMTTTSRQCSLRPLESGDRAHRDGHSRRSGKQIRASSAICLPSRCLLPAHPIAHHIPQHLQRNHSPLAAMAPSALNQPFSSSLSICKREFPEESSSPPYGSHENAMNRAMSAPTTSMESWWSDNDNSHTLNMSSPRNNHSNFGLPTFSMSIGDALTNAIFSAASGTSTTSPGFARLDSADGQLAHKEQDFSFSHTEIESWLSTQDHAYAESMHR